jgi:hypothetical protein
VSDHDVPPHLGSDDLEDLRGVGRVGDHQAAFLGDSIDDQVVHDPSGLGQDHSVLGPAYRRARQVVGEHGLEPAHRSRPLDIDLAEMGEVEHPDGLADGPVLGEHPGVLDGHGPPAELAHLGAERDVLLLQRRAVQRDVHVLAGSFGVAVV